MRSWSFAKGHGTENDFVVLKDRHAILKPSDVDVRFLCDRRAGIGADGVLRAIKAEHMACWTGDKELWFMDYRNADGSIAEMCGNGLRVFVRFLVEENLVTGDVIAVATRAGLRHGHLLRDGRIATTMGIPVAEEARVQVIHDGIEYSGIAINVGNPHCVVEVDSVEVLGGMNVGAVPEFEPGRFPNGANIEFYAVVSDDHVAMRVHERGVGETKSCGTGVVATAFAQILKSGGDSGHVRVDVPGGVLEVTMSAGEAVLAGDAVIVARGEVTMPEPS